MTAATKSSFQEQCRAAQERAAYRLSHEKLSLRERAILVWLVDRINTRFDREDRKAQNSLIVYFHNHKPILPPLTP